MNKIELKELAEIAMNYYKSEKKTIGLVKWASLKETRAKKMITYLNNNSDITDAKIRYEMCKIVADEQLK